MDDFFTFALERYNYWIVIILMMTGLYIVISRGNLVKKIVGLNLFQTSVFIFYITIGKMVGATAPIYIGDELYKAHGDDHGDGHGKGHDKDHGDAHNGAAYDDSHASDHDSAHEEGLHAAPQANDREANDLGSDALDHGDSLHGKIDNLGANDLKAAIAEAGPADGADADSLHDLSDRVDAGKIANDPLVKPPSEDAPALDIAEAPLHEGAGNTLEDFQGVADASHGAMEIMYANPLPHVLILTAIVVGVATTAVGLALAVRIREAYGAIEEDELEALDAVAEFGEGGAEAAGAAQ